MNSKEFLTEKVTDPQIHPLLIKACTAHPYAKSDEEASVLYLYDKESHDIDFVKDRETSDSHKIESLEHKLEKYIASLQSQLDDLRAKKA